MYSFIASIILASFPALVISQPLSTAPLPIKVACPSNVPLVRSAGPPTSQTLSSGETSYVSSRTGNVLPGAWNAYLRNVESTSSIPLPNYVSRILNRSSSEKPRVGIALSGGAYRAAFFGAAVLNSLDGRNATSVRKGTGGLLQAATYLSGLSGGAWLLASLSQANFPTIYELIFPPTTSDSSSNPNSSFGGFLMQYDLLAPGSTSQENLAYIETLISQAVAKHLSSGLPITITDVWSDALARHFINGTSGQNILGPGTHGDGILLSRLTEVPSFQSYAQPFPILVANTIPPNPNTSEIIPGNTVPLTSEIWEFNVYEAGSWDPSLASFIPTSLLGSTNSSNCMAGLDQASFIIGMSSSIFNTLNVSSTSMSASSIGALISLGNSTFPSEGVRLDSAAVPNPFKGVNPSTYTNFDQDFLAFVDGGSNGEVMPLQPLLVRSRKIDTIIAIDAASDTVDHFTNGTDLINTAKRAALFGSQYPFPSVPQSAEIFVRLGLNRRPTFFGCDNHTSPLLIYIANGGPPAGAAPQTNTSSTQSSYSPQEVQQFLDQASEISSQGINGTDVQLGTCVACAVVDRVRARSGIEREGVCALCFALYCWSGDYG